MKKLILIFPIFFILFIIGMGNRVDEVVLLKEGDSAPDFKAIADNGEIISLKDYRGRKVVLYFYPKDDTPGCTKEACSFRDSFSDIQKTGTVILGVSLDSAESHQNFKEKYKLPFMLLVDKNGEISKKYGVYKKFLFSTITYAERVTFIIDEKGIVKKIFREVDVAKHADEVKSELTSLETGKDE